MEPLDYLHTPSYTPVRSALTLAFDIYTWFKVIVYPYLQRVFWYSLSKNGLRREEIFSGKDF